MNRVEGPDLPVWVVGVLAGSARLAGARGTPGLGLTSSVRFGLCPLKLAGVSFWKVRRGALGLG